MRKVIALVCLMGIIACSNKSNKNEQLVQAVLRNDSVLKIAELLEKGADPNLKIGDETLLMVAAKNGYDAISEILLEKGADVGATNEFGQTALILASKNGQQYIIRTLLLRMKRKQINIVDSTGCTALMWASRGGYLGMTYVLIIGNPIFPRRVADIKKTNPIGWSALTFAINGCHTDIAQLLLNKGAIINEETQIALLQAKSDGCDILFED